MSDDTPDILLEYTSLALNEPDEYAKRLHELQKPSQLTYALEAGMHLKDSNYAREILLPYLQNPSLLVVEGTLLGLANHINYDVVQALYKLEKSDSPAISALAHDLIVEYDTTCNWLKWFYRIVEYNTKE